MSALMEKVPKDSKRVEVKRSGWNCISLSFFCDSVMKQNSLSTFCEMFCYVFPCSFNPVELTQEVEVEKKVNEKTRFDENEWTSI